MNLTEFWSLIDAARHHAAVSTADPEDALASALVDQLAGISQQELFEYQQHFERLHTAIKRWDIWAAGNLIGGGCSNDAFMDFRAGLIAQGRNWYDRAAASPDALADHPDVIAVANDSCDEAIFNELVNYAASYAYERINGSDDNCSFYDDYEEFLGPQPDREPTDMGENFDFADDAEMRRRLPRLAELFMDHDLG